MAAWSEMAKMFQYRTSQIGVITAAVARHSLLNMSQSFRPFRFQAGEVAFFGQVSVPFCRMQAVQDAAQAVLQDIQSKFAARSQQPSAMESLQAFCAAVDWKVHVDLIDRHSMHTHTRTVRTCAVQEPWILSLLAVQILLFVTVISARKQLGVLAVLFGIASAPPLCTCRAAQTYTAGSLWRTV